MASNSIPVAIIWTLPYNTMSSYLLLSSGYYFTPFSRIVFLSPIFTNPRPHLYTYPMKAISGRSAMEKEGRILHFEGIRNCRDLGGMITTSNQYIRKGLLLRSAHLKNATANDKYELQHNYHLTEILDLRNVTEQSENPDAPIPGAMHVDMPLIDEEQWGITHEENLPPYEIYPSMDELYVKFITDKPINANIARTVRRIMNHNYDSGAVLWHCYGGKDRCGIVAALILSALGASYPDIKEDYMMTNLEAQIIAEKAYAAVLDRGGPQKEADFEYDANIAKECFIDGAFQAIWKNHGDAISFLKELGGIEEEEIQRFRGRVLE